MLITDLELMSAAAHTGKITTVGHAFQQGDIPSGQSVYAEISGQRVDLQVDVKATWPDGSVKHALLSYANPGANQTMYLFSGTETDGGADINLLQAAQQQNYQFQVRIGNETVDAMSLLAQSQPDAWMSGHLASEARVQTFLSNGIEVILDIRAKEDGTIDTSVIVRRTDAIETRDQAISYDYHIVQNNITVQAGQLDHYAFQMWREKFSTDPTANDGYGVYDEVYLQGTNLVPDYGGISGSSAMDDFGNHYTQNPNTYTPLDVGLIDNTRGTAGATPDYGIQSKMTALYLSDQGTVARQGMLENADQYGGFAMNFTRDGDALMWEDLTVFEDDNLYLTDDFSLSGTRLNINPGNFSNGTHITSHKPDEYSVPYLVTGDRYYADGLVFQGNYNSIAGWQTDLTAAGTIDFSDQLRAQAWNLRDLASAASLTPDGREADLLNARLDAALQEYVDFYIDGVAVGEGNLVNRRGEPLPYDAGETAGFIGTELEGVLYGYKGEAAGLIRPYWQDFFGSVVGHIARSGNENAKLLGEFMANYSAGRFLQAEFNPLHSNYEIASAANIAGVTTWAQLNQLVATPTPHWEDGSRIYEPAALGAMANLLSGVRDPRYAEAYLWMSEVYSDHALNRNFINEPASGSLTAQLNTSVVFADRTSVNIVDRTRGTELADTVTDGAGNGLIVTGEGNDVISTGLGNHLVDAGDGDDVITASYGEDWIFGGSGADVIAAGGGINYLQGDRHDVDFGRFVDTFRFENTVGQTTIGDFTAGQDKLVFAQVAGVTSVAQVLSSFESVDGDAVLSLENGTFLRLQNTSVVSLSTDDIELEGALPTPDPLPTPEKTPTPPSITTIQGTIDSATQNSTLITDIAGQTYEGGQQADQLIVEGGSYGRLSGLSGSDHLVSRGWATQLDGGDGNDVLELNGLSIRGTGGEGADVFVYRDPRYLQSWITDFEPGVDKIAFIGESFGQFAQLQIESYGDLTLVQNGSDTMLIFAGASNNITLTGVQAQDLRASDFLFDGASPEPVAVPEGLIRIDEIIDAAVENNTIILDAAGQTFNGGNQANQVIIKGGSYGTVNGFDGNDHLYSRGWATRLDGGNGDDVIELNGLAIRGTGGDGADFFVYRDPRYLKSWITDFEVGVDKIAFIGDGFGEFVDLNIESFQDLTLIQNGADTVLTFEGASNNITLTGIQAQDLSASDFLFDA